MIWYFIVDRFIFTRNEGNEYGYEYLGTNRMCMDINIGVYMGMGLGTIFLKCGYRNE